MRRYAVAVSQVPLINREVDAVWQPRLLVATARSKPALLANVLTSDRQSATGTAALAGALTAGMVDADIAGVKNVQYGPPDHTPGQDDPFRKGWLFVSHFSHGLH